MPQKSLLSMLLSGVIFQKLKKKTCYSQAKTYKKSHAYTVCDKQNEALPCLKVHLECSKMSLTGKKC